MSPLPRFRGRGVRVRGREGSIAQLASLPESLELTGPGESTVIGPISEIGKSGWGGKLDRNEIERIM